MALAHTAKWEWVKRQRLAKATAQMLQGHALIKPLKRPHRLSKVPPVLSPIVFTLEIFEDDYDWAIPSEEVIAKPQRSEIISDKVKVRLFLARMRALERHKEVWG